MAPISLTDHTSTPNLRQSNQTSAFPLAQKNPYNGAQALWDPYKVLDIHPNDPDFSCMGIARYSNARCRWQFWDLSIRRAACKHLDSIASMRPSEVTRRSLELVAGEVLCHNHKDQMHTLIADWQPCIDDYSNGLSQQPPVTANPERESQQTMSNDLKKMVEDVRNEIERLKRERDASQTDSAKWKAEAGTLRSQQSQSLERHEWAERRLKGKVAESELAAKTARDDSKAKLEEITALIKQLTVSQKSETAQMDEIQLLKKGLAEKDVASQELESSHASQLADLCKTLADRDTQIQDLETSNRARHDAQTKSDVERSAETQRLQQSLADQAAASQELSSSHAAQLSDLTQSLTDRDTQIQKLETANQNLRDARTENKRRLSKLEQQNQKLKRQRYIAALQHAVQMLVEKRRVEQLAHDKNVLEEQKVGLISQIETSEKKMGMQERLLSSLKLQNVKKGVCAVVTTHPFHVSMKRCSRIRPLTS